MQRSPVWLERSVLLSDETTTTGRGRPDSNIHTCRSPRTASLQYWSESVPALGTKEYWKEDVSLSVGITSESSGSVPRFRHSHTDPCPGLKPPQASRTITDSV